jgi:hypothetical protein
MRSNVNCNCYAITLLNRKDYILYIVTIAPCRLKIIMTKSGSANSQENNSFGIWSLKAQFSKLRHESAGVG